MSVSEQAVIGWWRGSFDPGLSLGERIRMAGEAFADRPAVRLGDGSWMPHGALHDRAAGVRRAMSRSLEERGGAVGCLTGTNESLQVALIAVLMSAPSSTVLDPSLPASRNRQALDDIGARTLLADRTTEAYARSLARPDDVVIMLDGVGDASDAGPAPIVDDGVLTVFTSGSTGRPKGVRRPYGAMAHTCYNISWRFGSSPDDLMLYVGSPGHVGTLNDVLLSILNGFAAVPVQLTDLDLRAIYGLIRDLGVNKVSMPPSLLRLLLRHAASNGGFDRDLTVASSGEALLRSDVRLFFEVLGTGSTLWQSYGSTEAGHMYAGFYRPEHATGTGSLPLNSASRGVSIEVLDEEGRPVKPGETGSIRVRTPSLALGYTTGEAGSGFGEDERGRYFMTGDRAQLISEGVFVVEGRADRQINLHGRRVELGEIESAILATPGWGEACAALVADAGGRTTLLAMVSPIPGMTGDPARLRESLRSVLPSFAVPAKLVCVDALPRTTTGKVDLAGVRDTLAKSLASSQGDTGTPAKGPTENWVADAWQAVLGVEQRPSRDVSFDEFGGDSLNAVELCLRFGQKFGVALGMDFVTAHRTVASQAAALQDAAATGTAAGERVVSLRASDEGPVCVLVPGAGGHAWVYLGIAGELATPCELLALNLNFSDRDELLPERLRDTVLASLGGARAARPVVLVGYSRGCLIAATLGGLLREKGVRVGGMALIDPSPLRRDPLRARMAAAVRGWRRSRRRTDHAGARRLLDEQIAATRHEITRLYRPEHTVIGDMPCAMLVTSETARLISSMGSLYGRPVGACEIETVPELGHLDLMRKRGAPIVAGWLAARIAAFGGG
ncbi:MAG: alpha/beta fold hydrolase [Planctomycetota bacterium]|nr:MAG: alpha/beta fold hydrolase [Planctomycetota bacterium]